MTHHEYTHRKNVHTYTHKSCTHHTYTNLHTCECVYVLVKQGDKIQASRVGAFGSLLHFSDFSKQLFTIAYTIQGLWVRLDLGHRWCLKKKTIQKMCSLVVIVVLGKGGGNTIKLGAAARSNFAREEPELSWLLRTFLKYPLLSFLHTPAFQTTLYTPRNKQQSVKKKNRNDKKITDNLPRGNQMFASS